MITRAKLRAFLTPIAFYRAIEGSYTLEHIHQLTYHQSLSDQEWREAINLYQKHLSVEYLRNLKKQEEHLQLQTNLQSPLKKLKAIVQAIPEIRDVLLVNSYSLGALKPSSDIDIVVICEPQTLWWARLKLTIALERAGIRRKPGHIEEQICLSFFITSNSLNIAHLAYPNDLYLYFWLANVIPLFGKHQSAWRIENQWLRKYLPALNIHAPKHNRHSPIPPSSYLLNQLVRFPLLLRSQSKAKKLGPDSSIVISDNMLKFHNHDRRQFYREKTLVELAKLEQLINL